MRYRFDFTKAVIDRSMAAFLYLCSINIFEMIEKCRAIVLSTVPCATGPTLVKLYTRSRGVLTASLRAGRSKKSGLRHNLFHPLAIVDVEIEYRENRDIHRLVSADVGMPTHSLLSHPAKLTLALFMAELLNKSIRQQENDQALFLFLEQSIELLDLAPDGFANFHLLFMLKLTLFLGFFPQTEQEQRSHYFDLTNGRFTAMPPLHSHYCKGIKVDHLKTLMGVGYTGMSQLRLSREERNSLLDLLLSYYHCHLSPFSSLKTVEILRTLFV